MVMGEAESLATLRVTCLTWVLVLAGVLLSVAAWVRHRVHKHSLFSRLGIPYVPPHLIYGSNHVLRVKGDGAGPNAIGGWIQRYGKVFGYYVGWEPNLVVADVDLIQEILVKQFPAFSNRPTLPVDVIPFKDCVAGMQDQRWKDVRSLLSPTFSLTRMKHMTGIMNKKISELLKVVAEKVAQDEAIEWNSTYQALTLDVISECLLAMKTNCQRDQKGDHFFQAMQNILKISVNSVILLALYFESYAKILSFLTNRLAYSGRLTQIVISHVKKVIAARRKDLSCRYNDFLQVMIDTGENVAEINKTTSQDSDVRDNWHARRRRRMKALTDEEIIGNAWIFLMGGFETTANTATYTSYLLSTHPHVQDKLYQELQEVLKDGEEELSYEQVNSLKYLDQVVCEAVRYLPPVVSFVTRQASRDVKLGDLSIPKGTVIQIPVWDIHRDPQHWPHPDTFDPDRFSPEARAASKRHPISYLPFGAGPRSCPGMRFGLLEAKLTVARLLRRYRLEVCEATQVPLRLVVPSVMLNADGPVYLRLIPR